ncbi:hypothetical protein WICPIJ_008426 [Wickerhamomyces pijperi]|uniref:Glycoside hydrolase family 5 C-terminal domain-containing protein n=1 Tax=Wickerhamomyces pijperi TaxID=599730 RepID=A0A9P8TIN2_WICPI|nr:hypothetical protein WICPIJ_008426 [Wickerhamomyces pijperi]
MIWATNYLRLVAGTMFVLFFAGKIYAPKATINGVNIQDYLQDHFINSFRFLLKQITERAPEILHGTLLGVETMNEPNAGYLGYPDISQHPETQELRLGTCPTLLDSLNLGAGFKVTVDEYRISIAGPRKIGTKTIDPQGQSIWLATDVYDKKYGFVRGSEWELGKCLWEQHGVWDSQTGKAVRSNYFSVNQLNGEPVDEKYYINTFFIDHYKKFREAMRSVWSEGIMFLQPPPLELPPDLKNTDLIDNKTVFCPHYYDGCSLLFKTWNRVYNVNTLAIMRRRYVNPIFSVILGERRIRNSIRNQLAEMKQESKDHIGESVPVLFTEIGMPFDMDEKWAYQEGRGDFSSQRDALDALAFALEGSNLSHTWWCYTASNSHEHGDGFNGEDFSFWSKDDTTWNVATAAKQIYLASEYEEDFSYDQDTLRKQDSTVEFHRYLANATDEESNSNSNNNDFGDTAPGSSSSSNGTHQYTASTLNNAGVTEYSQFNKSRFSNTRSSQANEEETEDPRAPALAIRNLSSTGKDTYDGLRAIDSIIRPYAVAINGDFKFAEFDLSKGSYILQIIGRKNSSNVPTKVYIPEWHYEPDQALVEITSGYFKTNANKEMDDVGVIEEEILQWYHGPGEQTLIIKDLNGKERGRGRTHGIVGSLMSWILPCYF